MLVVLDSDRFADQVPATEYATLLDEGIDHCSSPRMYRILQDQGEVLERRNRLRHPRYQKPHLLATAPNQVWSWDITKLLGPTNWTQFYLYMQANRASPLCRPTVRFRAISPSVFELQAAAAKVPSRATPFFPEEYLAASRQGNTSRTLDDLARKMQFFLLKKLTERGDETSARVCSASKQSVHRAISSTGGVPCYAQ
jgi:hypothetical protein